VRADEAGKASGATNTIREIGGVMGVAVLASVFMSNGGYESPQVFNDGITAALPIGVAVLVIGAALALFIPGRKRAEARAASPSAPAATPERAAVPSAA
jgi:hypothetical protein